MSETKFKVLSENMADRSVGDILTVADLEGINIEALVEGGHIEPIANKRIDKKDEE